MTDLGKKVSDIVMELIELHHQTVNAYVAVGRAIEGNGNFTVSNETAKQLNAEFYKKLGEITDLVK